MRALVGDDWISVRVPISPTSRVAGAGRQLDVAFRLSKCKNKMWDVATPIVVAGHHVGDIFTGQFFFQGEVPDRDVFRSHYQTQEYGFNEEVLGST